MRRFAALIAGLLATSAVADSYPEARRIVTVGGPVTEIVFALGESDRIVARDTTSTFPEAANGLPDVGYMRALSAEGVLSVGPDLIISRGTAGPVEAIEQLTHASIPMVFLEEDFTATSVINSIKVVGETLGVEEKSDALAGKTQAQLDLLAARVADLPQKKRVLFILSLDGGRINAAGRNTGAHGIMDLAGGHNVMGDAFSGYKLVDAEAVLKADPEIIIMMSGNDNHVAQRDEVLSLPQLKLTAAGRDNAFVTIPGAALGFGPRTGELGLQLFDLIYAEAR